ncbi:hypothetical protein PM082_003602 [Marasmius tenuissimus]|nr:hypothetical protein PM082_003602 [Marasmius tenuissimus]
MPPLAFNLDLTIGALEIALSVSAFLVGCATVQAYMYYRRLIEIVSHITSAQTVYKYSVTEWGKVLGLLIQSKALVATVYLSAIIAPTVETFYLYRIYKFAGSKSLYIIALAAVVVWVRYGGWIFLSMEIDKLGLVNGRFLDKWSWLVIAQLSVGACMDTVISMTMVYFLWRKGNTGVARTTLIMHRIVRWTIRGSHSVSLPQP